MATLDVGLTELRDEITQQEYGGTGLYSALDANSQVLVDRAVKECLRMVYDPGSVDGVRPHKWSFLEITATLALTAPYSTGTVTVVAGVVTLAGGTFPAAVAAWYFTLDGVDYSIASRGGDTQITLDDTSVSADAGSSYVVHCDEYDLPAEFATLIGPLTYAQADNAWQPLTLVDAGRILIERQRLCISAPQPWLAAIVPVRQDATTRSRSQLWVWPPVTAAATITYRFRVRPDALDAVNLYPWGCSSHAQLFLAAARAAAELLFSRQRGPFYADFVSKLQASIASDQQDNKPKVLGMLTDGTDDCDWPRTNLSYFNIQHRGMVLP